jgi:hypothetical protein
VRGRPTIEEAILLAEKYAVSAERQDGDNATASMAWSLVAISRLLEKVSNDDV